MELTEIDPSGLATAICYHRKQSGLTQNKLAQLAGTGKTVVFDIEKNKKTIQLDTLLKVLKVLNIKMIFRSPMMKSYRQEHHEKS